MDFSMLNLNDLVLFAAAVEQGGFAAASRRLGIAKSTLSKRVAELENALAARLIHRTSRSFTLTELGRDFYEHARAALIEAEAAEAIVRRRQAEPSGTVRISASIPVAQLYLAAHLPRLARAHPKLQLQLDVGDRFVDVVQEGVDIAVRSHFAPLPDSGLVQRPVMVEPIILVAAADYLERHGTPNAPADLPSHEGLLTSAAATTWHLHHDDGGQAHATPRPAMAANESTVPRSHRLGQAGARIAGVDRRRGHHHPRHAAPARPVARRAGDGGFPGRVLPRDGVASVRNRGRVAMARSPGQSAQRRRAPCIVRDLQAGQ
jgi:DNA-binding transcriptional LysR family regulator